jgi:hypothetical protein
MVTASRTLDRVLVLEMVRVTEAAAVAASKLIGRGDEKAADHAAVEAMRAALNTLEIDGTVVIGEGHRAKDRHRARSAGGDHHHCEGGAERARGARHRRGGRPTQRA